MTRARVVAAIVMCAALAAPGDARAAHCRDRKPTTWDIEAGPPSEPGERLDLSGRVISRVTNKPLAGITVYVYHADAKGKYNLAGHENEPPRLCAILITNKDGAYRVRTSMPGGYGGYAAHIHFEVWGPRVARQFLFFNLPDLSLVRGADGVHRSKKDLMVGSN